MAEFKPIKSQLIKPSESKICQMRYLIKPRGCNQICFSTESKFKHIYTIKISYLISAN